MDYSAALTDQNRLLAELFPDADQTLPVPTCPDWTIRQLFRHVGRGDRWAAQIVAERRDSPLDPRTVVGGKPPDDITGTVDWLHGGVHELIDAVEKTGADTPVWTFLGPRPAAWWIRRRLHEATVHRADVALALRVSYDLSAALASDGISEFLDILAAQPDRQPTPLDDGATLHLHATDDGLGTTGEWFIRSNGGEVAWDHGHAKGTTAVRGRAVDLLLAVTRRNSGEDAHTDVVGDGQVWQSWLDRTTF